MCREDCLISETHVVSTKKKVLDMQNVSTKKPIENLLDKSYNDYINNDLCNIKIAVRQKKIFFYLIGLKLY